MKEVTKPSTILKWKGEVYEVVGTSEGKVIYMQPYGAKPCEKCGEVKEIAIVESSPLFQENAEPVVTILTPFEKKKVER